MSNSGQQTLPDLLAGCRLFVGTDVLVRARLGEEEAQAASPLLVLLPVDGEVEQNIRIPASYRPLVIKVALVASL